MAGIPEDQLQQFVASGNTAAILSNFDRP